MIVRALTWPQIVMYLAEDPQDPDDLGDYKQFGGEIRDGRLHFPDDEKLERYQAYNKARKEKRDKEGE